MSTPGANKSDATLRPPRLPRGPWIYKKMIQVPPESVANGSYIGLRNRDGALLARGILNRKSIIAFRVLGGPDAPESLAQLLDGRLREAWHLRTRILGITKKTNAWRLANSEGDRLSGLIVDVFGPICVAQLHSRGYVLHAEQLESALKKVGGFEEVVFHADARSQDLEGFRLPPQTSLRTVEITENGIRYRVVPGAGHKTGFFLDQRDNRALIGRLAGGRSVLDLCTNAGGFALQAAVKGRSQDVTAVDLDEAALEQARANAALNRARIDFHHADIFPWLRARTATDQTWDLVVLDPAKLAPNREKKPGALRTYHEMNTLAMKATTPGGLLFTCSCTGVVSESEFLDILTHAATAADRTVRILEIHGAAADHPVPLDFPEGRYLKAVLLQVQ